MIPSSRLALVAFSSILLPSLSFAQASDVVAVDDFRKELRAARVKVATKMEQLDALWGTSDACARTLRTTWEKAGLKGGDDYSKTWGEALWLEYGSGGPEGPRGVCFKVPLQRLDDRLAESERSREIRKEDLEALRSETAAWVEVSTAVELILLDLTKNLGEKLVLCNLDWEKRITPEALKERQAAREAQWQDGVKKLRRLARASCFENTAIQPAEPANIDEIAKVLERKLNLREQMKVVHRRSLEDVEASELARRILDGQWNTIRESALERERQLAFDVLGIDQQTISDLLAGKKASDLPTGVERMLQTFADAREDFEARVVKVHAACEKLDAEIDRLWKKLEK